MQASLLLQQAVGRALLEDPAIQSLGVGIYDGPSVGAKPPYISIGDDRVSARQWQGGGGWDHRFSISLWDAREGLAEAKAIMANIERVVLSVSGAEQGLRLTGLRMLQGTVERTHRKWTRGRLEFRVLTTMEAGNGD